MVQRLVVFWLLFLGNQGAVSFFPVAFARRERTAKRAVLVEGASTIATEGPSGDMTDLASRVTQALQLHKEARFTRRRTKEREREGELEAISFFRFRFNQANSCTPTFLQI